MALKIRRFGGLDRRFQSRDGLPAGLGPNVRIAGQHLRADVPGELTDRSSDTELMSRRFSAGKGKEHRQIGVLRKIRFAGKQSRLDSLARHLGLFKDGEPVSQIIIFQ